MNASKPSFPAENESDLSMCGDEWASARELPSVALYHATSILFTTPSKLQCMRVPGTTRCLLDKVTPAHVCFNHG